MGGFFVFATSGKESNCLGKRKNPAYSAQGSAQKNLGTGEKHG